MNIKNLQPNILWTYFYEICQIPHASHDLDKITKYLKDAFSSLGYSPIIDKNQNVFVRIPATKGYEKLPGVLLQAHSDMVAVKAHESKHDFKKDKIETIIKDGWIWANKTTLGADDGIGVAIILAIASDKTIKHGPLEVLITSNEETGMYGIRAFDANQIKSKYMINIDNEDDREVAIGCPGSIVLEANLPFKRENSVKANYIYLSITLKDCLGGHSGMTIAEKRINAIKKIFALLELIKNNFAIKLISLDKSGLAQNVIPFQCTCCIGVKKQDLQKVNKLINCWFNALKQEYANEKNIKLLVKKTSINKKPIANESFERILTAYTNIFNGLDTYNWEHNVPETSSNLGIIEMREDLINSTIMIRSPYDSAQERIFHSMKQLFEYVGGNVDIKTRMSGWLPKPNKLANDYQKFYKKIFNKEARQTLMGGAVETSFILAKKEDMVGISIGPIMKDVHSENECLNIESTNKIYKLLSLFLKEIK